MPAGGRALPELSLRETSDGDFIVVGAATERIHSAAGLTTLVEKAAGRRATSVNDAHNHSSRSHAFLTLHLERRTMEPGGAERRQTTRFHLVDLAGSENFSAVSAAAASINGGLLALGKVLMALASDKPAPHIPYRDATLTKMLKQVLTGNCLNLMLACINPTAGGAAESHNTLRYAQQASQVRSKTLPLPLPLLR